jgi:glycosyltransferase involved in cell wall biosynthesis
MGFLYKCLNPRGTIYLKMDFGTYEFRQKSGKLFQFPWEWANSFAKWVENRFIDACDVISVETVRAREELIRYNSKFEKAIYVTNGINDVFIDRQFPKMKRFQEKKNVILNIARLGSYQKNTEFLLEAVSRVDLKDFEVRLVGSVTPEFSHYVEDLFLKRPDLRKKVRIVGEIGDRMKVYSEYDDSRIYCFSSRYESCSMTPVEAAYFGNFILTTDVDGADEFTNQGTTGFVIPQ